MFIVPSLKPLYFTLAPFHVIESNVLRRIVLGIMILCLGGLMEAKVKAQSLQIWKEPSGLEVVFQSTRTEDDNNTTPAVAIQIWVKTGSTHEKENEAGISHFIEHMVFKGTKHYQPSKIAGLIEGNGGAINAYTSFDYTVFHVIMPKDKWQVGLNILSDMVQHAVFDPQELESERQVVLEEIRRDKDSPYYVLSDSLFATVYKKYPYRRPIIGYEKVVKRLSRQDVLAYYQKWYCPSNMVLVVVGDIERNKLEKEIKRLFPQEAVCKAQFYPPKEPKQRKLRLKVLSKPFKETYFALAFPIPGLGHPDVYALDVLSEILGEGNSSRLNLHLKLKKALVHSIATHAFTPMGPGAFAFQVVCEEDKLKPALKEIFSEIEKIKTQGVSPSELEKAKLNLESDFIYDQETMEGWARTLGVFQVTEGNAQKYREYVQKIRAVTAKEVKEVACKYLSLNKLSLVAVLPETSSQKLTPNDVIALWPQKRLTQKAIGGEVNKGATQKFVLKNGLTLLVKENHRLPTFAVSAVFMGGLRVETEDTNGICHFVSQMLTRGTHKYSAEEIAQRVDRMAASLDTFSGWNTFGATGHGLSRFFSDFISLFAEIIKEPSFEPEEIEKVRMLTLASIKQKEDRPSALAISEFYRILFGKHPYHMDIWGTPQTVSKFRQNDLKKFYETYAVPTNMVLSVVGDVNTHEVYETIKRLFGDWSQQRTGPGEKVQLSKPPLPLRPQKPIIGRRKLDKEQIHFVLGNLGPSIYARDKYALTLLDAILSGQGGRLFINLRDKQGLAYALSFLHREGLDTGMWGVYMATSKTRLDEAVKGVIKELNQLKESGVTKEELKRAKEYVLGNFAIGLQTNSQQALSMALNERYGLGYNYDKIFIQEIKRLTLRDLRQVIKKYITPNAYVLTFVGPID